MIQSIISLLLNLITFIAGLIIKMSMVAFPLLNLNQLSGIITTFYSFINQGLNFIYFMFGDVTTPIFIAIVSTIMVNKLLIIPIIKLMRKLFLRF